MSQNPAIDVVRELLAQLRPGPQTLAVADWTALPLHLAAGEHPALHLKHALARGLVEVSELPHPDVPTVQVENLADVPVLFPAGALLQGGAQTRIIATPALVFPHTTAPIEVRCVEAGRWETHRARAFDAVCAAPATFRTQKLSRDSRSRMHLRERADDQHETWREVDAFLASRSTVSRTASLLDGVEHTHAGVEHEGARQPAASRARVAAAMRDASGVALLGPGGGWASVEAYGTRALAEPGSELALSAVELEAGRPAAPSERATPFRDLLAELERATWSARPHGPATLVDFGLPGGARGTALVHEDTVLQLSLGWAA